MDTTSIAEKHDRDPQTGAIRTPKGALATLWDSLTTADQERAMHRGLCEKCDAPVILMPEHTRKNPLRCACGAEYAVETEEQRTL